MVTSWLRFLLYGCIALAIVSLCVLAGGLLLVLHSTLHAPLWITGGLLGLFLGCFAIYLLMAMDMLDEQ